MLTPNGRRIIMDFNGIIEYTLTFEHTVRTADAWVNNLFFRTNRLKYSTSGDFGWYTTIKIPTRVQWVFLTFAPAESKSNDMYDIASVPCTVGTIVNPRYR